LPAAWTQDEDVPAAAMDDAMTETAQPGGTAADSEPRKPLAPAAQRALAEAEARRRARQENASPSAREINGRGGLDPVRYGDWEIKGLTSDF
jgi:hypothetical protein